MSRTQKPEDYLEFRALLRRWAKIIDHYAYRRRRPQPVSAEDYPELHSDLLNACRTQLAKAAPAEKETIELLIQLISPWVTLEAVKSSRVQILTDLAAQCLAVEYVFDGGKSHGIPWSWIALAASLLLLVGLSVVLANMSGVADQSLPALADRGQRALRELVWSVRYSNFLGRFAFVTVIVVAIGILLLTKGLRKWT